ncbi:hypothetical protein MWU75_05945 [Ornithinimicrobium sp. F0845]|uniref:hypothetical protein n=1 Tax=Ornithinimicrobium sp. F0845 TaxID=2926412 RepID=UPI001FF68C66|nr:hypothetical protein [Ornithinimicrobium sp. F0845]MCK0111676.1 hypothetical protein [Ornithinimicrobium sp. F0845]
MAEPAGPGSVEREARHLVEAAARWLSAVPDTEQEYADGPAQGAHAQEAWAQDGRAQDGRGQDEDGQAQEGQAAGSAEEHLCRGCPWCRAKAALGGPVGADTLDSIAHLLGAAAESLSLFAQSRRDAAAEAQGATADEERSADQERAAGDERMTDHEGTTDEGPEEDEDA